jgi:hypothetical protein
VPGGTCTHWNCSATFSLALGCNAFLVRSDACVFGVYLWQTMFGKEDVLAGPPVALHRDSVGNCHRKGIGVDGVSITWPAAPGGLNEVTLRSGPGAWAKRASLRQAGHWDVDE